MVQPEGGDKEKMSRGGRGGRGYEEVDFLTPQSQSKIQSLKSKIVITFNLFKLTQIPQLLDKSFYFHDWDD